MKKDESKGKVEHFFRGGKISEAEIESLQVGGYVEMEGFISTSTNSDMDFLMKFADNVIFEILVPDAAERPRDDDTDFGFLNIS